MRDAQGAYLLVGRGGVIPGSSAIPLSHVDSVVVLSMTHVMNFMYIHPIRLFVDGSRH